jgi:hypothetical protein
MLDRIPVDAGHLGSVITDYRLGMAMKSATAAEAVAQRGPIGPRPSAMANAEG